MTRATASRRSFLLRGALGGAAVTVGLPILDMFMDTNGVAFAESVGGGSLPVRFGTWYWGCGMLPERWQPTTTGKDYDLPVQLAPIKPVQQHISVFTGYDVKLDGRSNGPHVSGNIGVRTGAAADSWSTIRAPTLDVVMADALSGGAVHRSLHLSADGNPRTSYSFRDGASMNATVPTASELYAKLFGADFQDPNKADFKPDPRYMARKSVLSAVGEQRRALLTRVGSSDRARLDQYFTSVREMENKLALQLQKPPRAEACAVPQAPAAIPAGTDLTDIDARKANHKLMAQLLAMALACNQTRVFNMTFSNSFADLRRAGDPTGYHQSTHEELIDAKLGYQPTVDRFAKHCMEGWADFVQALAEVKEGGGTLLDNTLVFAHSDCSFAKNHEVSRIPMMIAGRAGGKLKPGLHIKGGGDAVTTVGLTIQQAMGLQAEAWGADSMRTTRTVSEILA